MPDVLWLGPEARRGSSLAPTRHLSCHTGRARSARRRAQGLDANRVDLVVEKKMDTTAKAIYGADRVAFSPVAAASPQTT
jgi:hypothetical protein